MDNDPVNPQTGQGTPYSDQEGSSSENQSDDERWGGGTKKSEDEDNSSDNESPRNRTLESPKGSDGVGGGRASRKSTVEDLFGELSSDSDAEKPSTPGQSLDDAADGMEREQPDEEQVVPETHIIELEIPKVSADLGSDVCFATLPNFLFVEPKPFDSQYYEDEFEDEEMLDEEEGRARLKLKVENTIRWRAKRDEQGNETRESNARIVKWSDGSMSLHLGNEVFDVCKASPQGTHNHLFIRHSTFLQGLAVFKSKLTFRPHYTDLATDRKLSLADRCSKAQKVRMLPPGRDPESQRHEMIKREDERLRASLRRESQQRRMRMKQHHRKLSTSYLEPDRYEEEEEEEDGEDADISLADIKSRYKGEGLRAERARIYSSDSDEDSDDDKAQRLMKAKSFDGEEEEEGKRKAEGDGGAVTKRAKKSVVIISDEEDEVDDE